MWMIVRGMYMMVTHYTLVTIACVQRLLTWLAYYTLVTRLKPPSHTSVSDVEGGSQCEWCTCRALHNYGSQLYSHLTLPIAIFVRPSWKSLAFCCPLLHSWQQQASFFKAGEQKTAKTEIKGCNLKLTLVLKFEWRNIPFFFNIWG